MFCSLVLPKRCAIFLVSPLYRKSCMAPPPTCHVSENTRLCRCRLQRFLVTDEGLACVLLLPGSCGPLFLHRVVLLPLLEFPMYSLCATVTLCEGALGHAEAMGSRELDLPLERKVCVPPCSMGVLFPEVLGHCHPGLSLLYGRLFPYV